MNPIQTSPFDLPERLSAKSDPALIGDDEQHFAALSESLSQSIAGIEDRLDTLRRQPGGHGQAALERDLEIHRLSARLRTLRRFTVDACLGRMVPADGSEPVYIGRFGLRGCRGPATARRLAHAGGRAVLRGDPRPADGAREPPPLPVDRTPGDGLLG